MEFAPRHIVGGILQIPRLFRLHSSTPSLSAPESCTISPVSTHRSASSYNCTAPASGKDRVVMEAPPRKQLPPGFRFHPTDEELVVQYLRRKALARPLPAAVIPVVHAAALPDPWDFPGASQGEAAYFFSLRQAPTRGGGGRRRRAASGYWKATRKEKPVFVQLQGPSLSGSGKRLLVGVKTALAFHRGKGRAWPSRTDWIMHEYRLAAAPQWLAAELRMGRVPGLAEEQSKKVGSRGCRQRDDRCRVPG